MPNEGCEHEMAPEEESRARSAHTPLREQIVDLLARCDTHSKHALIISLRASQTLDQPACSKQR